MFPCPQPKCSGSGVVRKTEKHGPTVRRRHQCRVCSYRFTTVQEVIERDRVAGEPVPSEAAQ